MSKPNVQMNLVRRNQAVHGVDFSKSFIQEVHYQSHAIIRLQEGVYIGLQYELVD